MCVTETWNIDNKDGLSINGYNMIFRQRGNNNRGGGVAVYFKDKYEKIRHKKVEDNDNNMEELWVTMKSNKLKFLVGTIYRPPNCNIDSFNKDLLNTLQRLQKEICRLPTFILGDFNMDYAKKNKFSQFFETMTQFGFQQKIEDFTRETETTQTIIDLIFSNVPDNYLDCGIHADNLSDHHVIYVNYLSKKNSKEKSYKYRPINTITPDAFSNIFQQHFQQSIANSETNYLSAIQSSLITSLNQLCPLQTITTKKPFAPWMKAKCIVDAKRKRDKSLTIWRKDKENIEKKQTYKSNVKATTKIINQERSNYLSSVASKKNTRMLWSVIRNLQHKEKTKFTIDLNSYTDFYSETSERYCQNIPPSEEELDNYVNETCKAGFEFQVINASIIENVIRNLKKNKIDCFGTSSNTMQFISTTISHFLSSDFNQAIKQGSYPNILKVASIRPIPKINDPKQLSDFRPICLQPMLSKVFEICLNHQLNTFLRLNNVLYKHQFGFRAGYSTQMLLHLIDNRIKYNLDHGNLTIIIFLDFSKAFDTVCHLLLLKKLSSFSNHISEHVKFTLHTTETVQRVKKY